MDEGRQLVKGFEWMNLKFTDIKSKLHNDLMVEFAICYVGGHNYNEKIETKIRQIKDSLERTIQDESLSFSQLEVLLSIITNLMVALDKIVGYYEKMNLITSNRLCLRRNNDCSQQLQWK